MSNFLERVLCIYSTSANFGKLDLEESNGLNIPYVDNITYDEIYDDNPRNFTKIKTEYVEKYQIIVDCTNGNLVYNELLSVPAKFVKLKEFNYDVVGTQKKRMFFKGIETSALIMGMFAGGNEKVLEVAQKNLAQHRALISSIANKYFHLVKNRNAFNEGMANGGIDFTAYVKGGNGKKYILIDKIPEYTENGVEYITPDGIQILKDLLLLTDRMS